MEKNLRYFNSIGLGFFFILQALDSALREINNQVSILTNAKIFYLLILSVVFLIELAFLRKEHYFKKGLLFKSELYSILLLALIFSLISISKIIESGVFYSITVIGILRILVPCLVAYTVINLMELKDLYNVLKFGMVICFLAYVASVIVPNFSVSSISAIDFKNSNSPFESNFFSPVAIAFTMFFGYFRKSRHSLYLSVIFTILTFKRIMIIYAIVLLLGGKALKNKQINNFFVCLFGIIFYFFTIFYINLMIGNVNVNVLNKITQFLGQDINHFTMGRSFFFTNLYYGNFQSSGFYSSTISFRGVEMDLPQIYLEMGKISIISTIGCLLYLVKHNMYVFLMIVFCLLELLTSHWFDITSFWLLMYLAIGEIENNGVTLKNVA